MSMKRLSVVSPRAVAPARTDADKYLGDVGDEQAQVSVGDSAASPSDEVAVSGESSGSAVRTDEADEGDRQSPRAESRGTARRGAEMVRRAGLPAEGMGAVQEETWPTPIHLSAVELELLDNERSRRMRIPRGKRRNKEKLTRSSLVREAVRAYFGGGHR